MNLILKKCTPDKIFYGLILLFWSLGQFARVELNNEIAFYWHDLFGLLWIVFKFVTDFDQVCASLKAFFLKNRYLLLVLILPMIGWGQYIFEPSALIVPILYYLRILIYLMMGFLVYFAIKTKKVDLIYILQIFEVSTIIVITLGLGQYIFFPDMRFLAILGWDDHYYRLIYPFFDPAFTGLILVLFFTIWQNLSTFKNKYSTILQLMLIMCIALTFSRASYLSLMMSVILLFAMSKQKKSYLKNVSIWIIVFIITISLANKPGGEGVNLIRTSTIKARIENVKSSTSQSNISTFLLGTGFFINQPENTNHPVFDEVPTHNNQPDNYLVLFYSQLGILGTIILGLSFGKILGYLKKHNQIGFNLIILVLFHGLFNASLTQPFVLLLLALTLPWVAFVNQNHYHFD